MRDEAVRHLVLNILRIPSPAPAHHVFNIWILSLKRRIIQHIALELGILYIYWGAVYIPDANKLNIFVRLGLLLLKLRCSLGPCTTPFLI